MNNLKRFLSAIGKYSLIPLCICIFGIFVYPTMYKYDKLDQKFPVKINRITGETEILYLDGYWQKAGDNGYELNKFEQYKKEIIEEIDSQNEEIKDIVLDEIQEQLDELKTSSNITAEDIDSGELYDAYREQSNLAATKADSFFEGFTKGDTPEKVKEIMGTPDSIREVGPFETWGYGLSTVKFENGKVSGWDNTDNNLLIE